MALPGYLTTLKSSGVYTFEFDQSQIITSTVSTLRMIIGFSKVGPFNTPVFCEDSKFFTQIYGSRDKSLERRGSYFHLSALEMLRESPIIALNLRALDEELDQTEFIPFSAMSSEPNQAVGEAPLSDYYDTSKFWKLDTEETLKNINNQAGFTKSILNFANVGTNSVSVLVTSSRIQGLDISAKDWYGEGNVPEFMDEQDYINDFAVSVQIIKGDFSDYQKLSIDPLFGAYFDTNGLKKTYTDSNGNTFDGLSKFIELQEVIVLASFDGVIIPNFLDKNGNELYIQDIINLQTPFTGVYCAVDEDLFDTGDLVSGADGGIDLIGGTIDGSSITEIDYISYYGAIAEDLNYADTSPFAAAVTQAFVLNTADNIGATSYSGAADGVLSLTDTGVYTDNTDKYDTLTIYSPDSTDPAKPAADAFADHAEWFAFAQSIKVNSSFIDVTSIVAGGTAAGDVTKAIIKDVAALADKVIIQLSALNEAGTEELFIDGSLLSDSVDKAGTTYANVSFVASNGSGSYLTSYDSATGIDFRTGVLSSGDTVEVTGSGYEDFTVISGRGDGNGDALDTILGSDILSHEITYYVFDAETSDISTPLAFKSLAGNINQSFTVTKVNDYEFTIDNTSGAFTGAIKPEDFIIRGFEDGATFTNIDSRTGNTRFTRISSVKEDSVTKIITVKTKDQVYFTNANTEVERYKSVQNFVTNYQFTKLDGFSLRDAQVPNGTAERQNEILSLLVNTGLFGALADKEAISFRYIVDTFEGTIEPGTKNILSDLCKTRQFAFAILNSPSVKQLSDSTNPLFKFNARSNYDPRHVGTGGNQDFNPSNTLSLPTVQQGANYAGYFHPNLVLKEGSSVKTVPPASYVSNNFVEKYKSAQPYSIVAGPRRGVVAGNGITGVEYVYDRNGLNALEPFGINVILPKQGIGLVINSNQTAQQSVKSALSKVHVRELLIYIEEEVENILKNYQFEFNTVQTRLEIKTLVDGFLSQIQNDQGLFNFETVMNSANNTPEVIDNDFGIIDIAVEPVKGLEKLVQRVTILRTGGIDAGEFQIQGT